MRSRILQRPPNLLLPKGHECHFLPLDVALNNLTSSITEDRHISLPQPVDFAGN
jgi:hypothetical protein